MLPKAQQGALGPKCIFQTFPLWSAHSPKEDGITGVSEPQSFVRQRYADCINRGSAYRRGGEFKGVAKARANLLQDGDSLGHNLGADAISRKNCDLCFHDFSIP